MSSTHELLDQPILILDGGLGTTLEDEHNIKFSSKTPLWSSHLLIDGQDTLKGVHQDFVNAGADILLTATYQTSLEGFEKTGISRNDAEQYMRSAVPLARFCFSGRPGLVALSLGAYGATMIPSTEYSGEYGRMDEQDLYNFHNDRLMIFYHDKTVWSDVDLVAFETLPRLDEVRAVITLMQGIAKPYWISCVFPRTNQLPDGSSVREIVEEILKADDIPFGIGINCTKLDFLPELVEEFASTLPPNLTRLVLYPDGAAGLVYDTVQQKWIGESHAESWEEAVFDIVRNQYSQGRWRGIVVGGCCKTNPKRIAALRSRVDGVLKA